VTGNVAENSVRELRKKENSNKRPANMSIIQIVENILKPPLMLPGISFGQTMLGDADHGAK
jgi:hypothetical protein